MISHPNVKINLGLRVLRKRPDGYHDLETVFVPCFDICDELSIEPASELSFSVVWADGTPVPWPVEKDLSVKAYFLLREDFDLPCIKLRLVKHSPVGAGLGGGSSDAAFALKMLNEIFALGLSDALLAQYASRLGSDCPFFIYNRCMVGSGRGELLTPLDLDLEGYRIKIIVPDGISVCTADAYRGIVPLESRTALPCEQVPLETLLGQPVSQWKDTVFNDFETTVFEKYPQLADIKKSLYDAGALYVSMSGSGSALFFIETL